MKHSLVHPSFRPLLAFTIGAVLSLIVWWLTADIVQRQEKDLFEFRTQEKISAVIDAVEYQEQLLFGGVGFFNASEEVSRNKWRKYVEVLWEKMHLAGAQGLGFAVRLAPEELPEHVRQVRADGFPDYSIRPEGERSEYTSIIYLEPFDQRNQEAFGYDMFSEPVRRKAMEQARDTGRVAVSGKVTLVQEIDDDVQAGFLIYMPVYRKGQPISTVEERRAALYGYVYSPFRARNFVDNIFQNGFPYTHVQIFDGPEANVQSLLFDSDGRDVTHSEMPSGPTKTAVVEIAPEHKWTLRSSITAAFRPSTDRMLPLILLGIGILLSLAFGSIVWFQQRTHTKAQQLQDSEQRHRVLFDSSQDALMTLVPPSWKFESCNPATLEMFRIEDETELTTLTLWALSPEKQPEGQESADVARAMIEKAMNEGSCSFEWTQRRTDGETFPADMMLTRMVRGEQTFLQATVRDITDRKQAEEERTKLESQLHQAQKMESVGRLAGGVAHDFNNLLTGITGYIQLAQMDLSPSEPLYEMLGEVHDAVGRAADLTRQLLAFSRKQIIQPRVINLNDLIWNLNKMLVRIIGEDVGIKTIPQEQLGRIKADPGQVEQIIINLSVNARDAMPDGGKLTIETADVSLDDDYCKKHLYVAPGYYVMLAISDNGEGMDKETQKSIFEPFFTTKRKGQGTGLGLATVYGIVKQHNGHIEVYSEVGKGTVFKVYFPQVHEKAEAIVRPSPLADILGGTETVLIVEDESMVRNTAVKILTRLGYKVMNAEDGPNALAMMENQNTPIDLLLTDVVMPHMNGRELAEKVKELYPSIKVLFSSGYTEDTIAHHGVLDEGIDFIGKPYTPQSLAMKVRTVLDG